MIHLICLISCTLLWFGQAFQSAAAPARSRHHAARQDLVRLKADHFVWAAPDATGEQIARILAQRPLTGAPTALPVLDHVDGWIEVRLPGRQLGRAASPPTGWIIAQAVTRFSTPWHIVVRIAKRRALIFREGRLVRSFRAIVGKPSTPTPRGEFFVEENVALRPYDDGAPYALATSARSSVLQEFRGGPGQIALHGLRNLGGRLGTAASHGCVRLSDSAITWLALRIGRGVPLTIR